MKINRPDIVEVSDQGKDASPEFVVPDFDLVIITARNEKRLRAMEINAANRPLMLVEAIDEGAHAIVPKLDGTIVQAGQDPWTGGMEGKALDTIAFRFKLGQHCAGRKLGTREMARRSLLEKRWC